MKASGAKAIVAITDQRGRDDLSTYVKIFGANPVSARAVIVRDEAKTHESPIESTEIQIVTLTKSRQALSEIETD